MDPKSLLEMFKHAEIKREYLERNCRLWVRKRATEYPVDNNTTQKIQAYQNDLDTVELNLDIIQEKFFEITQNKNDFEKLLKNIAK